MKVQKGSIESTIWFCLSPVLSLPVLLYNISRGNKVATTLLSIFLGLIGYLFIPSFSNDKTRYLERYELFKDYSFGDFLGFLGEILRPDFIFDFSMYFFASTNINAQILFFLINTFVTYTVVQVGLKLIDKNATKIRYYGYFVFFLVFSLALQTLFSGVRFYYGLAFALWSIYYTILDRKSIKALILLILAVCTHFSLLLLAVPIIGILLFPAYNYRYLFLLSLVFLILPKQFLGFLVQNLNFSESYNAKADQYLESDLVGEGIRNNVANAIVFYIRQIWLYVAYAYLVFFKRKKEPGNHVLNLLYLIVFFVNLTFSIPTVFLRYSSIIKMLFAVIIVKDFLATKNIKSFAMFFVLYLISFVLDIYLLRINLAESLFYKEILTSIGIITKKISLQDVIY